MSALDPAGTAAADIARLWWIMLTGAALIALFVFVLLGVAFLPGRPLARVRERSWLLWGGLVFPAVTLTALLLYALLQGENLLAHPREDVTEVRAVARQWQWEFHQPGATEPEINVLRIPAGRPVDLKVESLDVVHSLWIPRLGGKIDAVPGHVNTIRLQADRPGTYRGVCAEFCGTSHSGMFFTVEAVAAEIYNVPTPEGATP